MNIVWTAEAESEDLSAMLASLFLAECWLLAAMRSSFVTYRARHIVCLSLGACGRTLLLGTGAARQ
jgi:hypothetical protein